MVAVRRMAVQPEVLAWARTTASLDISEAAQRMGVSPERVSEWERGEVDPTIKQLRKAADVYTRPFAALFMDAPLSSEEIFDLPDFRRPEVSGEESATLRSAILRARQQRDAIQEVVSDGMELSVPPNPTFQLLRTDSVDVSAEILREALGLGNLPRRIVSRPDELLRKLVQRVEQLGFLVIQVQRVSTDEMRGFSLAGEPVSVIALNGADWPRGKIFTLLHELVHVAVRHSGLCDLNRGSSQPEERYCDEVAAAALMPVREFRAAGMDTTAGKYDALRTLADNFGVSAESALIRMVHLQMATWDEYSNMKASFRKAYVSHKQDEKDKRKDKDAPIYYQLKVRDLGRPFIATMLRAHDDGLLSSRDVTRLLDVTYDKLPKLAARLGSEVPL